MRDKYSGSCLCGSVSYEIDGGFDSFYLCHCEYCRKDTGSANAANLFSSVASLNWISGKDEVRLFNLPSTRHSKCFCSVCGSALPMQQDDSVLVVPAGSLDCDLEIRPNAHIFVSSKADWDVELEKIPMIEKFPI